MGGVEDHNMGLLRALSSMVHSMAMAGVPESQRVIRMPGAAIMALSYCIEKSLGHSLYTESDRWKVIYYAGMKFIPSGDEVSANAIDGAGWAEAAFDKPAGDEWRRYTPYVEHPLSGLTT